MIDNAASCYLHYKVSVANCQTGPLQRNPNWNHRPNHNSNTNRGAKLVPPTNPARTQANTAQSTPKIVFVLMGHCCIRSG